MSKRQRLRLELQMSIEVDGYALYHPNIRVLRQELSDLGDDAWLRKKGWHIV